MRGRRGGPLEDGATAPSAADIGAEQEATAGGPLSMLPGEHLEHGEIRELEVVPPLEEVVGRVVLARLNGARLHPAIVLAEHPNDLRDVVVFHPPSLGGGNGQCFTYIGRMPPLRNEGQSRGWKARTADVAFGVVRAAS